MPLKAYGVMRPVGDSVVRLRDLLTQIVCAEESAHASRTLYRVTTLAADTVN